MSFSSRLIPTSRQNPCPVCDSTSGACRILADDTIFCHSFADAIVGGHANGYVCVKPANGHTATFKPDNSAEWTENRRLEWVEKKRSRQKLETELEQQIKLRALSAQKRHELYSDILDQLSLSPATIRDLEQRGFSKAEIEGSPFRSAQKWQQLEKQYDFQLPGIGLGGNTLKVPGNGCLCPVTNVFGEVVGIQLRLDAPIDGNRYLWLSSTSVSVKTKEFNELPLAVYIPSQLKSLNIQLVEGVGFKPYLAAERLGVITIGASGGNHTSSPETLKTTINAIHSALCQLALENDLDLIKSNQQGVKLNKSKELLSSNEKQSRLLEIQTSQVWESPSSQNDYLVSRLRNSSAITENLKNLTSISSNFIISPDAGFALNPCVIKTLLKTTDWLQENFPDTSIFVNDWNQIHQSQGDIDELKDLSIIRRLKLDSFLKKYQEVFDLDKGFANKRFQEWATIRTKLTADIIQHEEWLSIPKGIENVPIYVACPEFVNMTQDLCPYPMKRVQEVMNQRLDMLLLKAVDAERSLVDSQYVIDLFAEMGQQFSRDPWFTESLKDAKELKYEHSNLKLTLKTALVQAGHQVVDSLEVACQQSHDELQQNKEKVKRREAQKIFDSSDISWSAAQELANKDVDYDTKCKIRKSWLKHQLPGIEKTDSWTVDFIYTVLLDKTQFLDQRWRLKQLQDQQLFNASLKSQLESNFEFGFSPVEAWKSRHTKIEALKLLGVGKLIESGIFSSQDVLTQSMIDQYYHTPEWFDLIGISKANRAFSQDGSPRNRHYVKTMADRFLGFFGLECGQANRSSTNRSYTITAPKALKDYLSDIDQCLHTRALAVVEEVQKLSLQEVADKAEQRQMQQREKHQNELNQRILESQLTHHHSDLSDMFPFSIYINQGKHVTIHCTDNIPTTEMSPWSQPVESHHNRVTQYTTKESVIINPQTQSQTEKNPVQNNVNFFDKNADSGQEKKPVEFSPNPQSTTSSTPSASSWCDLVTQYALKAIKCFESGVGAVLDAHPGSTGTYSLIQRMTKLRIKPNQVMSRELF